MEHKIFSAERVNTGRQREVDLLKAFSIIMMIVTHVIDDLYVGYDVHTPFMVIDDILAQSVGAMGFMICMGIGVVYSRNASWDKYVRRGVSLLITGQLLNIFRYAAPSIVRFVITGDESARDRCMLTFSSDILEFAGLFFICMALFRYLKLKSGHILAISIIANIVGTLLSMKFNTGYYGIDQLIGMVVFTETESYFPLLSWLIYPAFGIFIGDILQHVTDKKRFYGYCLVPTAIVWAVYYYIGIFVEQDVLKFYNEWQSMAHVNIADALFQLVTNFSMLCMFYFLSIPIRPSVQKGVEFISRNINRYYCVHSVIVFQIASAINSVDRFAVNTRICYMLIVAVTALTTIIVLWYDRHGEPIRKFVSKHRMACYSVVIIISVFLCFFASMGGNNYPNLHNDYGE
jgi:uncharacterized membrane protein